MIKRENIEYIINLSNDSNELNDLTKRLHNEHEKYVLSIIGEFAIINVLKESEE